MRVFPFHPNGNNGAPEFPDILLEEGQELDPSDGNNKKYHRPPARYDDRVWTLGWTDGRLGQPEGTNAEVLLAQARVDRQREIRRVRDRMAEAQAKVEALKARSGLLQDKLEHVRTYYWDLWKQRNGDSSGASLPLGLMYLFFGLLLFLADVPLSVKLVAEGLGISKRVQDPNTKQWVNVGSIFIKPLPVLQNLWDCLFLALGIALMGILVKFFVDTILFRKDDAPPLIKNPSFYLFSAAFLLFVVATIFLGLFRAEVNGSTTRYGELTFISLTLVLPLAGGICFSAGWRRVERAKHYYFTLLRLQWLEWRHGWMTSACSENAQQVDSLRQILDHGADDLANSVADLRRNLYLHGYRRGQNVPETLDAGSTLYGFCERTLKRALARRIRNKLQLEP
jgi:hypothetical protein